MNLTEAPHFHCEPLYDEGVSADDVSTGCLLCRQRQRDSTHTASEGYSTASDSSDIQSIVDCEHSCTLQVEMEQGDESGAITDSLTLALHELRCRQLAASFFETHQRMGDSSTRGSDEYLELQCSGKRSSSLKSKKTPPGTPNQIKKAVRFADTFGLDLADVRHVFDRDNPPVIPANAMRDLDLQSESEGTQSPEQYGHSCMMKLIISPRFAQPGDSTCFLNRVFAQKVMLERAVVSSDSGQIEGLVRVLNLSFEKSVTLIVTYNSWTTSCSAATTFACSSNDGASDQFRFALPPPQQIGDCLSFCVKFCANSEVYWDNNLGENYTFDCYAINSAM